MGYKNGPKLTLDLSYLGDNNGIPFFVEIKNPRLLTFNDKSKYKVFATLTDENEKSEKMKEVCKELIISWNLLDIDTEEPVEISNEDSMNRVPSYVLEQIMQSLAPQKSEEVKN